MPTVVAHNRIDETGNSYGRLTVLEYSHTIRKYSWWLCKCICGNTTLARGRDLRRGHAKSCGCIAREGIHTTHGLSKTAFYRVWAGMRQRCEDPKQVGYKHYGGRGIKVCDRWKSFENFYEDMYDSYLEHKKTHSYTSIDRINNDGNYSPDNCRWADRLVQANNKQRKVQ